MAWTSMPMASMSAIRTAGSVAFGMISAVWPAWYSLVSLPAQKENGSYSGSIRPLTSSRQARVTTWAWMSTVRPLLPLMGGCVLSVGGIGWSGCRGVGVLRPRERGAGVLRRTHVAG